MTREEQSYTYPDDVHQIRVPAGHKVAIQWDHKGTIHEQRIAEDTIRAAVEKAPWVGDCFMCDAELDFRRRQDAMDHFTKHEAQIRRSAEVEALVWARQNHADGCSLCGNATHCGERAELCDEIERRKNKGEAPK